MRQRPFLLLCLSFLMGVLLCSFSPFASIFVAVLLSVFVLLYTVFRRPLFLKSSLLLAFMGLGCVRLLLATDSENRRLEHYLNVPVCVTGVSCSRVSTQPLRLSRTPAFLSQFVFKVERVEVRKIHEIHPEEGYVQVFLTTQSEREVPHYGQRLLLCGTLEMPEGVRNPGGFDYRQRLAVSGITATMRVKGVSMEALGEEGGNFFVRMVNAVRERILDRFRRVLTPDQNALMTGILFGERNAFSGAQLSAFENTGTVHILATAGLHVGIVALFLVALFRSLRLSRRVGALLSMGGLIVYAVMAEGRPAVIRAVVIACAYLFARVVEREADWWNALALASLVLLLMRPLELFEAGFLLSFATVITLVLWMPLVQRVLERLLRRDSEEEEGVSKRIMKRILRTGFDFVAVAFVAQVGITPLLALYFHTFSLSSVPTNALVVPCVAPIMGLGFLAALAGFIHPLLAFPFERLAGFLLDLVLALVNEWGRGVWGVFSVATPPVFLIWLYYGVLWGVGVRLQNKKRTTVS